MVEYLDKIGLAYLWGKLKALLNSKVDKVSGKGLSTNDYTDAEKNKVAGIAAGAEVNVQSDWNATEGDAFIKNKPSIPAAVAVKGNAESSYRTGNVNITPANIGLSNVGNFKAVSTAASQGLTDTEKSNARANIGAGTGTVTGVTIGTEPYTPTSGVVTIPAYPTTLPASDVSAWAKAATKPTYTLAEVGVSMSVMAINTNTSSVCGITGAGNSGKTETIIYTNSGSSDLTVTVPTTYATPDGEAIELTCVSGGYCEVNYLNVGGTIYARGL